MSRPTPTALASAVLLTLALMLGSSPSASAATSPSVTIHTIAGKKAKWHKKVTVKPSVTTKGNVVDTVRTLTVKKGKKTVVKGKASAKLRAGRYQVTTKVSYHTWKMVTKTRTTPTEVVELPAYTSTDASCTITSETPVVTPPADPGETPVDPGETPVVDPTAYSLALSCTSASYTGAQPAQASAVSDGLGGWAVGVAGEEPMPVTETPSFVGDVLPIPVFFDHDLVRTDQVKTTYRVKVTSKKLTKTKTQKLRIKEGKRPSRTDPVSAYNCPSWAPIKGNASSMIYHLPGQRFYDVTKPEDCFTTQSAARSAGYRMSKV
ncbi:hypothetical protein [uncultured Friedmanniella sp.]|uniref:sunset domain-containing protein n=1 Tax=uncultured Friedmanniella sp. TaxID=335381 RepID=UPI0035CC6685